MPLRSRCSPGLEDVISGNPNPIITDNVPPMAILPVHNRPAGRVHLAMPAEQAAESVSDGVLTGIFNGWGPVVLLRGVHGSGGGGGARVAV